jgi:hypothetical protein
LVILQRRTLAATALVCGTFVLAGGIGHGIARADPLAMGLPIPTALSTVGRNQPPTAKGAVNADWIGISVRVNPHPVASRAMSGMHRQFWPLRNTVGVCSAVNADVDRR